MIESDEEVAKKALEIVETIIDAAFNVHNTNLESSIEQEEILFKLKENELSKENEEASFKENEEIYDIKNIDWPTIGQFTVDLGSQKIDEFIKKTWEYNDCWLYCIDFIEKIDKEFTTLYQYRCRWSIPTRRKPISRFTASVYFTYNVSKIKPKDVTKVQVMYQLETQRVVHEPGKTRFRQEWLNDILKAKEITLNTFRF